MRTGQAAAPRAGRALAALFLGAAILLYPFAQALAEGRVALVLGNDQYHTLSDLPNAKNDAISIAENLEILGFDVLLGVNASKAKTEELLAAFYERTKSAESAVFYYAGHGIQVDGKNYLIPVDARINTADDVVPQTVQLNDLLAGLSESDAFKIVLLDACQNNPLPPDSGIMGDGLAPAPDLSGFLIGYATQPGKVAYDGAGRNSPYATALLAHMNTRGLEVLPMLSQVNHDVRATTGGGQIPYVQFSIKPEFYFYPGEAEQDGPEIRLWRLAAKHSDDELLQIYLERYPEGRYSQEARSLLTAATPVGVSAGDAAAAGIPEELLWSLATESRNRELIDYYLRRFPQGKYRIFAERLAKSLDEPAEDAGPELLCQRFATHPHDETATVSGVSLAKLSANADAAISACGKALQAHPDNPQYQALLARSYAAKGDIANAVRHYTPAAEAGNNRALVSLGLLYEAGQGVPRDPAKAVELYERAVAQQSDDGAINLAVALFEGRGVERNVRRAIELLTAASERGSARATYNLAVLAKDGVTGSPEDAPELFLRAARQGYPAGYYAAAALYDEGVGAPKSPDAAAENLLLALGTDNGETLEQLSAGASRWSRDTIKAMQQAFQESGYYDAAIDGLPGPKFSEALRLWRLLGPA